MANLLDTNIVSQRTKTEPHKGVMEWLLTLSFEEMYISVVSLAEIRYGIDEMSAGRKRNNFEAWLQNEIPRTFSGRILPIDEVVAVEAGRMLSRMKANNRRPDIADAVIAATARIHGLRLATLNRVDFEGLPVELVKF